MEEFRARLDAMAPALTNKGIQRAQEIISERKATARLLEDLRGAHAEFVARARCVEAARAETLGNLSRESPEARRLRIAAAEESSRTITARATLDRLIRAARDQVRESERKARQRRVEISPVTVLRTIVRSGCQCGCVVEAQRWLDRHTASGR